MATWKPLPTGAANFYTSSPGVRWNMFLPLGLVNSRYKIDGDEMRIMLQIEASTLAPAQARPWALVMRIPEDRETLGEFLQPMACWHSGAMAPCFVQSPRMGGGDHEIQFSLSNGVWTYTPPGIYLWGLVTVALRA